MLDKPRRAQMTEACTGTLYGDRAAATVRIAALAYVSLVSRTKDRTVLVDLASPSSPAACVVAVPSKLVRRLTRKYARPSYATPFCISLVKLTPTMRKLPGMMAYELALRAELLERNAYRKFSRVPHTTDATLFSLRYGSLFTTRHRLRFFTRASSSSSSPSQALVIAGFLGVYLAAFVDDAPVHEPAQDHPLHLAPSSLNVLRRTLSDVEPGATPRSIDTSRLIELPISRQDRLGELGYEALCVWEPDIDLKLLRAPTLSAGSETASGPAGPIRIMLIVDVNLYPLATPIRFIKPLAIDVDEHRAPLGPPSRAAIPIGFDTLHDRLIHASPPINVINADLAVSATKSAGKLAVSHLHRRLCATDHHL
ncbi:uncharacterized protein AMSG_10284 [Thecamonas trahens ATCC 50062]|uniref:Uncharacterized protein n=1 Tax=Thecamonas trahens ATCC 50062 TaxID=461836 RepID=A0A0L0DQJ1_THETB|nr:hypothetical protein AMSG_10284 [Thecamonas trahens ATCC 50062]KNC54301.1 hypothetical protein AMSG_10284 [Thecamonas trahens ATCC 50062]|eukprot:XP_013753763.1 hypothetical protein AMSG_10284 [Thecamonas trahens ATCC 50062]